VGNANVSSLQQGGNLLDFDDDVAQTTKQMSSLDMSHKAMRPNQPLQRMDSTTSDLDVFVDAEEK
jgi:hypothetical protein